MSILNSNRKSKKHVVYKKYKLLIEFNFKDNQFVVNQKLNSFFGQIGIYEGADKLSSFIDLYFKSLSLDFKNFSNNIDDNEVEEETNFYNETLFLQATIYFYYAEKKCDFFLSNVFKKNFFVDKNSVNLAYSFIKCKQWISVYISKFYYYTKIKEYLFILKNFKNLFSYSSKFYGLLNFNTIDFLKDNDKTYNFVEELFRYKKNVKKRILFFKKIFNRSKNEILSVLKKSDCFFFKFILNIILNKFLFINYYYDHANFFAWSVNLFSYIYGMKNKLFNKFRRYKKFKKNVNRSLFGKKITYVKIYSIDLKKKSGKKK